MFTHTPPPPSPPPPCILLVFTERVEGSEKVKDAFLWHGQVFVIIAKFSRTRLLLCTARLPTSNAIFDKDILIIFRNCFMNSREKFEDDVIHFRIVFNHH